MSGKSSTVEAYSSAKASEEFERLENKADRKCVDWHGRQIVWRRFGNGSPLVLIHGGHGSWLHWVRNIEALARHHTLWLPDLPGFGDSDDLSLAPHAPDRMQHLVNALAGSLDILVGGNTPIDLAGFSFGGLAAARLSTLRGGIRKMALLGPSGHGGTRRQTKPMVDWRLSTPDAMREALLHNLSSLMLHAPPSKDGLAISVYERCCIKARFRSKAISRAATLQSALEHFTQPLLLIWGEQDVTGVPEEIILQLASERPGCDWCVLPNAGHWVQYERANDVNRLLQMWFGGRIAYSFDNPL